MSTISNPPAAAGSSLWGLKAFQSAASTVNITGLDGATDIVYELVISMANIGGAAYLRFNGDTSAVYNWETISLNNGAGVVANSAAATSTVALGPNNSTVITQQITRATVACHGNNVSVTFITHGQDASGRYTVQGGGFYAGSANLTQISVFGGGTVKVWVGKANQS